jgi:uncharacterized protein (TIGR03067 family)
MRCLFFLGLTGWFLAGSRARPAEPAKGKDDLSGTWTLVKAVRNGKPEPARKIKDVKVVINKGALHFLTAGKKSPTARFTLDPAGDPPAIDLVPTSGGFKDKAMPGIYELMGDDLKLCFAVPGKKRPRKFDSPTDSGNLFLVLRRAKP